MIELKNTTALTLQPGQTVTFDEIPLLHTGCSECFNKQLPNSIKLNNPGCAIYELNFSGNITSVTTGDTVQLAIAAVGMPLVETAMNATPAAAGTLVNVSTGTYFKPGCSDINRVSVMNTGATPVTIAPNANFRVVRKS